MERGMGMTHRRPDRVADVIRRELARALREDVRDPEIGFVTLTGVDLSPDLRSARVFFSTLNPEQVSALHALRRATPFLRRTLARRAGLRLTPELHFVFDRSVTEGSRLEELLRDLSRERERRAGGRPVSEEDDGEPGAAE
jgi:ribosome-binding factor A